MNQASSTSPPVTHELPVRGELPDPGVLALSGLDQLRLILRQGGPGPPIHFLTGVALTEAEAGACTVTMPVTEWLLSPQGLVSGGGLALVADAALALAVQATLPPYKLYTTAAMTITLLRPVRANAEAITARGRAVRSGRRLAITEALLLDGAGRTVAVASSRCHVFAMKPVDLPLQRSEWSPTVHDGLHPYQRPPKGEITELDQWQRLSGLELAEKHQRGELPKPPIHYLTGTRLLEVAEGSAATAFDASPWLMAPHGDVHGGALALLADSALALAVQTTVEAGAGYAMLDLTVAFHRPLRADGVEVVAHASVVHSGRSTRRASADITDGTGRAVARADANALILETPFHAESLGAASIEAGT